MNERADTGVNEMHRVRVYVFTPDNLSMISVTYMVEEENQHSQVVL